MEKIHIMTDSSADIPQALVEKHGIEIIPITLTHEGRTIREYYDITPEEYCKLLETSREIPTTAMITPTVFLDSYRRAGRARLHALSGRAHQRERFGHLSGGLPCARYVPRGSGPTRCRSNCSTRPPIPIFTGISW